MQREWAKQFRETDKVVGWPSHTFESFIIVVRASCEACCVGGSAVGNCTWRTIGAWRTCGEAARQVEPDGVRLRRACRPRRM
jgi:hypothetical protein